MYFICVIWTSVTRDRQWGINSARVCGGPGAGRPLISGHTKYRIDFTPSKTVPLSEKYDIQQLNYT